MHLDEVAGRERRQRRVVGLVRGGELGRVLRHDAGEAAQRQRDVVIGRVVVAGAALRAAASRASRASAHIISAKNPRTATAQSEQQRGDLEEGARLGLDRGAG